MLNRRNLLGLLLASPLINFLPKTNKPHFDDYSTHIQHIPINVLLGREEMFELGKKGKYYRYISFHAEITNE